ncbi:MAG: DmsE family decaheme c-type cytochrome [Vicinamibacterales bacterium]
MPYNRPAIALAGLLVLSAASHARAQATPQATWSVSDCQSCHEPVFTAVYARSAHAKPDQSCAKCHQNVAEHVKAKMAGETGGPVPSIKSLPAKEVGETCLTCHEKSNQLSWHDSMHARRDVSCTSCHSVHFAKSNQAQLKTRTDAETCFTCHKSERAKSMRASHHPVREGRMACSSCHNPHEGNNPSMLKADHVNELCYTCHTEKRGPFAFEHAPVREDCVSCHEPHGTNHPRLLTQKMPTLCFNCHFGASGHFGGNTVGDRLNTESGQAVGTIARQSRWLERSCRTCHVKVHGTNHPSGAFLVR